MKKFLLLEIKGYLGSHLSNIYALMASIVMELILGFLKKEKFLSQIKLKQNI